jgi:hypothetical protein
MSQSEGSLRIKKREDRLEMNPKHLCRIGSVIVLSFLVLLLADGRAHASGFCIPYLGCFGSPPPTPRSVPEIDAGMAVSGVTLLIASTMVLLDRFRHR